MNRAEFEKLVADQFHATVPEKFRDMVRNVAFTVEDAPSRELRRQEGLRADETLLGLYRGVPRASRGDQYGVGPTVPDIITLFRLPIEDEAQALVEERAALSFDEALAQVVGDTVWHEVGHYLGLGEEEIRAREKSRSASPEAAGAARPLHELYAPEPEWGMNEEQVEETAPGSRPGSFELLGETPEHFPLDPIEVDTENDPSMSALHESLLPSGEDFISFDLAGGQIEGRGESPREPRQPKKGEPPANLPTEEA